MEFRKGLWAAALIGAASVMPASAAETPKHGGILTYMIPAESPPSLDGHRETTYATAPLYSVLIRVDPQNPSSTTDFVCDLRTGMPTPTDGGKTYTFNLRDDVKFHDGTPLTAADVAKSWQEIVHPSPGISSARQSHFAMVDSVAAPDPHTVVFHLKFRTSAFLPALADPFAYIYKKEVLDKDPHWYETHILGSGPFEFVKYEIGQSITGERYPGYHHKGLPYLNRNVDQPYNDIATWVIDQWRKVDLHVTQKVLPTGPFFAALRNNAFDVTVDFNYQGVVNPILDVGKYLPHSAYTENYGNYQDQKDIDLYQGMLHETDPVKLRARMREYETYVLDTRAHEIVMPWWYRIVPYRSYVRGWKVGPSHYVNQDLATVWLDK